MNKVISTNKSSSVYGELSLNLTKKIKTKNKQKYKSVFNMHSFLLKNHREENVHFFGAIGGTSWNWTKALRVNMSNREGMLIFLDNRDKVLYIGHTNHIGCYINQLKNRFVPYKIFVVFNSNPSKLKHAVEAYRAKFKPLHNSPRNVRFLFDSDKTVLNLAPRYEKIVDWIKRHQDSTLKDFTSVYKRSDVVALCKVFNCLRLSYKELKMAIIKYES